MKDFKVGDKVVCTNSIVRSAIVGKEYTVVGAGSLGGVWISGDKVIVNDLNRYHKAHFKLDPLGSFNLKTDPWKIRTGTPEISRLTQLWLFEQGIGWGCGDRCIQTYNEYFLTNCQAYSTKGGEFILHGLESNFENKQATEIKLEFETIVKSVTLIPSMLPQTPKKTDSEIQLEELFSEIAALNAKADVIKNSMESK